MNSTRGPVAVNLETNHVKGEDGWPGLPVGSPGQPSVGGIVSGVKNLTSRLILCVTDSTMWFKIVILKLSVTFVSQCMYM